MVTLVYQRVVAVHSSPRSQEIGCNFPTVVGTSPVWNTFCVSKKGYATSMATRKMMDHEIYDPVFQINHLVAWQFHDNSSWSIGLSCHGKNPSSSQIWSTRLALKTGRLITWVCLRWFVYFVNGKSTMTGESIKWFVFLGTPNQQIHSRCPWKNDTIRFPREFHHGLPLLRVSSAHVWSSYYYMSIYIYIMYLYHSISPYNDWCSQLYSI
jgi:hypothetical protein